MERLFVTEIKINESRNIKNLTIPLSEKESRHLIITGKNGSGKTSLLNDLFKFLTNVDNGNYQRYFNQQNALNTYRTQLESLTSQPNSVQLERQMNNMKNNINGIKTWFTNFGGVEISFSDPDRIWVAANTGDYLITFFDAKRQITMNVPGGVKKINLKKKYNINERANREFIQYIVNLKADRSFARDDGEHDAVHRIDEWFEKFESRLQNLFDSPTLKLNFDRKKYNFEIREDNKLPFSFDTLADGYSAIITIAMELLMRMEGHGSKAYDMEGVVLIDEIETHLHVDLQKKVLPFLVDFFPKLQFIVTTHSPFVLSSLSNAVVCDLESSLVTTDLSGYSYDALIESYFNSDKYSEEIKQKIQHFESLVSQDELSNQESEDLRKYRNYFSHVPKYLSKELMVKLQQIELQNLKKNK